MNRLLLTLFAVTCSILVNAQDSLRTYYAWSLDAYKQNDYAGFLKYAKRANELRPNHPILAYNIASAYALNQMPDESIVALRDYLFMNASLDFMNDMDFVSLKDNPEFQALKTHVSKLNERLEKSSPSFSLNQEKDHFESITYHPKNKSYLMGSVTTRTLFEYADGELSPVITAEDNPLIYGVMGIDYSSDYTWVCTAALPEINGFTEDIKNKSSIIGINPSNGKIKFQYEVPNAILGDVLVVNENLVLSTDGLGNKVYMLNKNEASIYADLSGQLYNLQGLAYADGMLYLADYILGLHVYNTKDKTLSKINNKGLYADKGTDGLLYSAGYLYCFQNGTTPKRVFRIKLKNYKEVESVQVLDQNLYEKGEPTQGVIVDEAIYYISNSAWDAHKEGVYQGAPDLEVRKIKLD